MRTARRSLPATPRSTASVRCSTRVRSSTRCGAPTRHPHFPDDGKLPSFTTWFPPVGGFRFGFFAVPPESHEPPQIDDIEAAVAEFEAGLPGLPGYMEPDAPGMHTTDTIDFEVILDGEVWLELDDGVEVHLEARRHGRPERHPPRLAQPRRQGLPHRRVPHRRPPRQGHPPHLTTSCGSRRYSPGAVGDDRRRLRVLCTSTGGAGHIGALAPIALALRDAGHDVRWAVAR